MRNSLTSLVLAVPLLVVACEGAEIGETDPAGEAAPGTEMGAPVDATAVEAEIDRVRDAWVRAAEAGDAATVASLYADDAIMVNPEGVVSEGRQAIQQALSFEGMTSLEVNSTDTEAGTDFASDMGTFSQTFQTPEGEERTVSGRYLVVLRRQGDGWRITQHLATPPAAEQQDGGM